jgi:hypothetical protein
MADPVTPFAIFLDVWFWTTIISVAGFSIILVWLIMHFIMPMKNSFARHIVKARRENRPVVFADAGKYFKTIIGEKKTGTEEAQIIRDGINIVKAGNVGGMKYCEGVLMGIAEDFRSLVANVAILDLMEMIDAKGWEPEEVKARLTNLEEYLKKDLGFTDDVKEIKEQHVRAAAAINARYNAEAEKIIAASYPRPAPEKVPEMDTPLKPPRPPAKRGRPRIPVDPEPEDDQDLGED